MRPRKCTLSSAPIRPIKALARRWSRNTSGNISMIYAFALIPTIGLLGLGTDWYRQQSYKARLDAAADAAALAAITTAQAYINANSASQTNPMANAIAAGKTQAASVFAVNAGSTQLYVPAALTVNFPTPAAQTLTATVSYTGSMPTNFGSLVGTRSFPVVGSSTSSLTMGKYIDFYLMLDVSGSMGIPTSTDGQKALAAVNPDNRDTYKKGCVFACHYQDGSQGYTVAKKNNISLRIDTVGQAVTALIQTATQTETLTNQYRIGIYPFIVHAVQAAALSPTFTAATTVASNLGNSWLDQGTGGPTVNGVSMGSGGTHFENLANDMANYVKLGGDGSKASSPKPFIFLVTDGIGNNQTYSPFSGSAPQLPDMSFCSAAKSQNVPVSILYIPYVAITDPVFSFANDEDDKANNLIAQVPATLQSCTTSTGGYFFTANSQTDINSAMQTMFFQALQAARLTQ